MEQEKKPWLRPELEELSVNPPGECNPGWPQGAICNFQGVPQYQTSCNQKPTVLS
ncbi:MAG: hypothetical protein HZA22_04200 [Nitrospirae bacterium]|nr:hypothetical protein [Nitrospirota bacterium]MBI5694938.1 hypothetical protein [Nitrospirota bacterium]